GTARPDGEPSAAGELRRQPLQLLARLLLGAEPLWLAAGGLLLGRAAGRPLRHDLIDPFAGVRLLLIGYLAGSRTVQVDAGPALDDGGLVGQRAGVDRQGLSYQPARDVLRGRIGSEFRPQLLLDAD